MHVNLKDDILKFLLEQKIMTLATISNDYKPQNSVILYFADNDFNLYFITDKKSRKAQNIKFNNNVCASIWQHQKLSLQVEGTVTELNSESDKNNMLDNLASVSFLEHYNFIPPVIRINAESELIFYKIKTNIIRCLDLSNPTIKSEEQPAIQVLAF